MLGDTNDSADRSHRLGELQFATEKRLGLCPHARRLEGHHLTARESGLVWTGNLVAASRVKPTEPQILFHIAQSSYGTEL